MSDSKFSLEDLQGRSYRDLQQLAKSLCLPSNVKKIYLVQLIYAKKFKTAFEVEEIVQRVKFERQQMSQGKKRPPKKRRVHLQGTEISSTSSSQSPPIQTTPKRRGHIIQRSPDIHHSLINYSRPSMLRPFVKRIYTSPNTNPSDRVLRSCKPKQSLKNIIETVKSQNSPNPKENQVLNYRRCPKVNVMVKKQGPNIIQSHRASVTNQIREQLVPFTNKLNIYPPSPAKRQRVLSGIYPIPTKENSKVSYNCIQSVGFRRSDGKMSKINALVQKLGSKDKEPSLNFCNVEISVQDLINSNVETQNVNAGYAQENINLQYPNMSSVTESEANYNNYPREKAHYEVPTYEQFKENQASVYYHKKIRAEQVRVQRRESLREVRCDERLPKIHDVFSKFRDVHGRDVTQPIYVQVSDESERILNYPVFMARPNTSSTTMLESLYNFKSQFLISQPLLQIATTTSTKCVFSTPLIATPKAFTSTVVCNNTYNVSSCERDSQFSYPDLDVMENPRMNDYIIRTADQEPMRRDYRFENTEDFSTSGSSVDKATSQTLESSATIPEMVEDALEIISQDGDYMERIGMDVRVQCILCSWAGPRFILEYHIRKEHSAQIQQAERGECSVSFSLGGLARQALWLSRVVEHHAALYVVSATYSETDCLTATVSMLSSDATPKLGHLTIYNKVTGEPHTWSGEILPLSPNLPYYTDANCFTLNISSLNLLPNSANLVLINRELVIKSPGKVIVGRPELDDIQILLYVRIDD